LGLSYNPYNVRLRRTFFEYLDSGLRRNDEVCWYSDMSKQPCVYMLASGRNGTLYVGVTSNLIKRVWEHKNHVVDGFTKKYKVDRLVWYEVHETMESAIQREKAIKEWLRAWKMRLIEKFNPAWADLYETLC
jgi:putative endonuclease